MSELADVHIQIPEPKAFKTLNVPLHRRKAENSGHAPLTAKLIRPQMIRNLGCSGSGEVRMQQGRCWRTGNSCCVCWQNLDDCDVPLLADCMVGAPPTVS